MMTILAKKLAMLALIPVLTTFAFEVSAQNRERPSLAELDANEDGKLSLEEFSKTSSRRRTPEEMFERLDTNGDGYIVEDEVQAK